MHLLLVALSSFCIPSVDVAIGPLTFTTSLVALTHLLLLATLPCNPLLLQAWAR